MSKIDLTYLNNHLEADLIEHESLADHNWYKTGGKADLLVYPRNRKALIDLIRYCDQNLIEHVVIGDGANLLISDEGYRGVVIKLSRYFKGIERKGTIIETGAGLKLEEMILYCIEQSLAGFEYLSGIPGTVGGALIMNAGTDKAVISNCLLSLECLNSRTRTLTLSREDIRFSYRSAPELQDKIIISARFDLKIADRKDLSKIRDEQLNLRCNRQPLEYPSCGSVFKRPAGSYAGKLIDDLGLKGLRHKGAMVSEKHAGFIVNTGNATSAQILALIREVRTRIYEHYGILLEPEVRFLGFDPGEIS